MEVDQLGQSKICRDYIFFIDDAFYVFRELLLLIFFSLHIQDSTPLLI